MSWGAIYRVYTEHNLSTGLCATSRTLKIQYLRELKGIIHKFGE
jgi:hypothetical protein